MKGIGIEHEHDWLLDSQRGDWWCRSCTDRSKWGDNPLVDIVTELLKAMKDDHIPGFCYICSNTILKPCKRLELIAKVEEYMKP